MHRPNQKTDFSPTITQKNAANCFSRMLSQRELTKYIDNRNRQLLDESIRPQPGLFEKVATFSMH